MDKIKNVCNYLVLTYICTILVGVVFVFLLLGVILIERVSKYMSVDTFHYICNTINKVIDKVTY